jgi:hypothetical protein
MEPVDLYRKFDQEFFYNFHKYSTDIEIGEMGKKYGECLNKHGRVINGILTGKKCPDELRKDAREDLEYLARSEAKFPNEIPADIKGDHFEAETGFSAMEGALRRLVDGRTHLVRLIKPSEYDKNYWFYTEDNRPPQNVFCSEFGWDLIEFLKSVEIPKRSALGNLRKAISFQKFDISQFWTLGPYLHYYLMELGYSWTTSIQMILRIAGKQFRESNQPFMGVATFQLGYDERMPTHLLARMEALKDVACLKNGEYKQRFGIEFLDRG